MHEGTISSATSGSLFDVTTDSHSLGCQLGSQRMGALLHAHYPSRPHEFDAQDFLLLGGYSEPA